MLSSSLTSTEVVPTLAVRVAAASTPTTALSATAVLTVRGSTVLVALSLTLEASAVATAS